MPSGPPKVGYVTLNQTRKIVPLLETDPVISLVPVIGEDRKRIKWGGWDSDFVLDIC